MRVTLKNIQELCQMEQKWQSIDSDLRILEKLTNGRVPASPEVSLILSSRDTGGDHRRTSTTLDDQLDFGIPKTKAH